jgi:hypothetical protein
LNSCASNKTPDIVPKSLRHCRLLLLALPGLVGAAAALAQGAPAQLQPQPQPQPQPATQPQSAAPVAARPAPQQRPSASWASLTPAQRATLAPLQRDWDSIDYGRQRKWLEIATRFPGLSADEQQRVQQRMNEWARMTPEERGRARVQFQETRQLSPQERQASWEAYQALPAEQKRELAQRAVPAAAVRPSAPSADVGPKSSIVRAPSALPVLKPVGPTLIQVAPGATTTSVTRQPAPPLHQQPGLPKMAATPTFVDKNTLLPKRGAQAAATVAEPAASQAARRP